MIYYPNTNATIIDVMTMVARAAKKIPVLHLSPLDSLVDTKEEYIMTRLMSGRFSLKPNITQQGMLFRGDSSVNEPFASRLQQKGVKGHGQDVRQIMIPVNVKRAEFELMIESFPLYQMLRRGVKLPNGKTLRIENPYGLAYTYDYPTSMVGLTSDLDVAAFYAVTKYDCHTGKYEPVLSGRGVLYVFELRFPFSMTMGLSTLGRQVFLRTQRQKTFLLELPQGQNFGQAAVVSGFVFNHDAGLSKAIYDQFNGGESLAPTDDFLLKKIKSLPNDRVSRLAFQRNLADNPNDDPTANESVLNGGGLSIDDGLSPLLTEADLETVYKDIDGYWRSIVADVYIPGNKGQETKEYLMNLGRNPLYSRYFNLKEFFCEK